MKTLKFNVEKTSTGYSAYREEKNGMIITTGANLAELRTNVLESYNLCLEESKKKSISQDQIAFQFDLSSFFEFYPEINTSALCARIGMHKSLLSEYINGKRLPSYKQIAKILNGVKELGKELVQIEIV